jgi:hypothetical protein
LRPGGQQVHNTSPIADDFEAHCVFGVFYLVAFVGSDLRVVPAPLRCRAWRRISSRETPFVSGTSFSPRSISANHHPAEDQEDIIRPRTPSPSSGRTAT